MAKLKSKNLEINFFDNESSHSDGVIFIHGNSSSHESFKHQFDDLNLKRYRLIAFDLPGHGESQRAADYSIHLFVSVLKDMVEKLKFKRFILAGHSLGGHVALHSLKTLSPHGIFIFATPPLTSPIDMSAFRAHPELLSLFKSELSDDEVTRLMKAMFKEKKISQEDIEAFRKTDPSFRELFGRSLQGVTFDECELLQNFKGPKAVLTMTEDELVNDEYVLKKVSPEFHLTFEGSHYAHLERPLKFNRILNSFCQKTFV